MRKLKFWGYLHISGTIQIKRWFSDLDITEAKQSDFVKYVAGPIETDDFAEARKKLTDMILEANPVEDIWQPMNPAVLPDSELEKVRINCRKAGIPEEQIEAYVEDAKTHPIFLNDKYQVSIHEQEVLSPAFPAMWHLSIKRSDKEPIFDWRDIQRIKNELIGPENEGVQLFPAESRKVDGANQFHLFVIKDKTVKFPFGFFDGRKVTDESPVGGRQRKGADK